MAKPITTIKKQELTQEEMKQQSLHEIEAAISDNKDAILQSIELMSHMHKTGALEMMNALFARKDEVLKNIVSEANREPNANILKNASQLLMLLGTIDIENLQKMSSKMNDGLREAASSIDSNEKTSLFQLLSALKDPEINRAITMLLHFLKGLGRIEE
ncbi:DUF1641 domain-containing protein [Bacillus sp. FJAT-47783]|uniref:DUF1641 domain-containing protein n=1 Tax=Bacillus sp. FJAT-47783 TaxID=2922712 RepID=UPI001FAC7940|nr:DUF1641 domain-containing protein [Bacillus sp. FJAT-47783]